MKTRHYLTKFFLLLSFAINLAFAGLIQEVNFDTTEVNASVEQIITLANTGDLPLVIYKIKLKSASDSFELIADTSYTISGGDNVDIKINFIPKTSGHHSAILYIESNDEENSHVKLHLSGEAYTTTTSIKKNNSLPTSFKLNQNYPNPFNPSTTVKYQLPTNSHVNLTIYNIRGEKVATLQNSYQTAGYHQILWNGNDEIGQKVSSGVYFLRMQTKDFVKTISMTFTK